MTTATPRHLNELPDEQLRELKVETDATAAMFSTVEIGREEGPEAIAKAIFTVHMAAFHVGMEYAIAYPEEARRLSEHLLTGLGKEARESLMDLSRDLHDVDDLRRAHDQIHKASSDGTDGSH